MVFLEGNEMRGSGAQTLDCSFFKGSCGLAFARQILGSTFTSFMMCAPLTAGFGFAKCHERKKKLGGGT